MSKVISPELVVIYEQGEDTLAVAHDWQDDGLCQSVNPDIHLVRIDETPEQAARMKPLADAICKACGVRPECRVFTLQSLERGESQIGKRGMPDQVRRSFMSQVAANVAIRTLR